MTPFATASIIFAAVFLSALSAFLLRLALPANHLSTETKDTVKLAMGLVATMAALVLGLLVASAKGSYDTDKNEVTAMAAKVDFLGRILVYYGPEAAGARNSLHHSVEGMILHLWPETGMQQAELDPRISSASSEETYRAIRSLSPGNDEQKALQSQALAMMFELGQMRWLLFEQADSSISTPLLVVVVCWLAILFFSFGLFAPSNGTAITALMVAALSVAGAIFLILELDQPFGGLIRISNRPMLNALGHLGK